MLRRILYAGVVSCSALLLFLIQPMMGKAMLPWFGGSAGVWTTAMLFFQTLLVVGYAYAHAVQRLAPRLQAGLHAVLVSLSLAAIFFALSFPWGLPAAGDPVVRILVLLTVKVGLPYLVLSSTGPLVQAWWTRSGGATPPYWLFAISNAASLAALLMYPFAIEPLLSTGGQLRLWSVLYLAFAVLLGCVLARGSAPSGRAVLPAERPPLSQRALWAGLAACPSVMWLAIANLLSQDIAPVPLLWILALAIYLLSFILCFQGDGWYRPAVFRFALPLSWVAMCYALVRQGRDLGLKEMMILLGGALFVCCMFCHGELARRRPKDEHLTSFYLWIASGGATGGVFVGLIAPRVFDRFLELPLAVAACVVLGMRLLYRYPLRQVARLAAVGAAAFVFAAQWNDAGSLTRLRVRNFYGSIQVSDAGAGETAMRLLSSGTIHHGAQFLARERSRQATTYYGPASGVARAIAGLRDRTLRVAVIGLGAGTLAAYGRAGDAFRFYEINPAVIGIAWTEFRYLRESAARVDVVGGDGRLAMERETGERFDLVALDAFSGDSIPTHLLTREAFALYFSRLTPGGAVAVNITNQYLDLAPVVRSAAEEAGWRPETVRSAGNWEKGLFEAVWVIVKAGGERRRSRVWTDDYSSVFEVLR